jgi:hypothetical protein
VRGVLLHSVHAGLEEGAETLQVLRLGVQGPSKIANGLDFMSLPGRGEWQVCVA